MVHQYQPSKDNLNLPIGPIEVLEYILTRLLGERILIEPNIDNFKHILWSDAGTQFKCWKLLSLKEIVYGHFELCSLALKMTSSKRFLLDVPDMVQALREFHAEEMHCNPELTSPEEFIDFFPKAKDLHMCVLFDESITCCPPSDGDNK